jgi:ferrous iron transport protein B
MKLSELKTGEKAVIVKVLGYGGFRKRIVEMGFIEGKIVESILNAPFNDPIKYRIMGYEISLRRSEASQIEVISIEEANRLAENQTDESFKGTFTDEDIRRIAFEKRKTINVALVGNPNSGKTSLFNIASGKKERVGNYSGVTVEEKKGDFDAEGYHFNIVDLPGTYSLSAYSEEEKYIQEQIVTKKPDIIINVVDASNLERNLYLTTQLIDMNVRMVIALNMYDELEAKGDVLDYKTLEKLIGIPIVPTVSTKRTGIKELFRTVIKLYESSDIIDEEGNLISSISDDTLIDEYLHTLNIHHKHEVPNINSDLETENHIHATVRHIHINHGDIIENAIDEIKSLIAQNPNARDEYTPRYQAIKLLEKDEEMEKFIIQYPNYQQIISVRDKVASKIFSELKESPEEAITDAKYGFIAGALKETFTPSPKEGKQKIRSSKIDNVITQGWWSYVIFVAIMFFIFSATFFLGDPIKDFIEKFVMKTMIGEWFIDNFVVAFVLNKFVSDAGIIKIISDCLHGVIVDGVGNVLGFFPYIFFLYFFLTFIEATGYMSRATFIMDKFMHKIGLHGQSIIPLIMGLGCNVPAIMATRTIKDKRNRLLTMFIMPFMSCSTKYPIYILLAGIFFVGWEASVVTLIMYFTGFALAGGTALLFKLFRGSKKEETPFVMELPPYRIPIFKSLFINAWHKGKHFLFKVGTWILFGSIIIWGLSYFPRHEETIKGKEELTLEEKKEQKENSWLGQAGKIIHPVMKPLGFNANMSVSLLSGLFAKEIVITTLGIIYGVEDEEDEEENKETAFLYKGTFVTLTKIEDSAKIKIAGNIVQDSLGILYELKEVKLDDDVSKQMNNKALQRKIKTDIEENIKEELIKKNLNEAQIKQQKPMKERAVSLSFILFILTYFPCISTIIMIRKESGSFLWTALVVIYTLVLAWIVSFIAYTILSCVTIQNIGIFILVLMAVFFVIYRMRKSFIKRRIEKENVFSKDS